MFDNSVKKFHSANNSPSENSHDPKPRAASFPRKQNKTTSQIKKNRKKYNRRRIPNIRMINNELLIFIKKHTTDTHIEQTKTKPTRNAGI